MAGGFKYRVLLADEDDALLTSTAAALRQQGYVVLTARDGFEALAELRAGLPEIIISDLKMPNMSGFELLAIVRQRFPSVGVIARSAEFCPVGLPEGVLADRFVQKGRNSDFELIETLRELLSQLPLRTAHAKPELAPAWIPRNTTKYVVITCPSCLRSSSVRTQDVQSGVILISPCLHCGAEIRYRLDSTISHPAEEPTVSEKAQASAESSRQAIVESQKSIQDSRVLIGRSRQ